MANDKTTNTWIIDTEGIIHDKPICIRKAILFPNAAEDVASFMTWSENGTPELNKEQVTGTITSTNQLVSTGHLPTANVDPGDIIEIYNGNGTTDNWIRAQIKTNADNNTIVIDAAQAWTNEAAKLYNYNIWTPTIAWKHYAQETTKAMNVVYFSHGPRHGGTWFPNLALDALTAGAIIHLFIA